MNAVDEKYEHHCNQKSTDNDPDPFSPPTGETVDARGDGALVGQVSGDAALVLGGSASDEGGVEDEPVLGSVSSGLKGSEKTQLVFTFTTHRLTVTIYLW